MVIINIIVEKEVLDFLPSRFPLRLCGSNERKLWAPRLQGCDMIASSTEGPVKVLSSPRSENRRALKKVSRPSDSNKSM